MTAENNYAGRASNELLIASGSTDFIQPGKGNAREARRASERAKRKEARQGLPKAPRTTWLQPSAPAAAGEHS